MSSYKECIETINAHMHKYPNTKNSDWYVGIAADARARLFNDHSVDEKADVWVYVKADSSTVARDVEKAYHDSGHDGGPGGGDNTTVWVYAYVKSSRTSE